MNRFRALLWLAVLAWGCGWGRANAPVDTEEETMPRVLVTGYLPDYRVADYAPAAKAGIDVLVLFSAEATVAGGLDLSRLPGPARERARQIKMQQGCLLLLSVGGWDRSAAFPALAADAAARGRFAAGLVEFCREEGFDGVDLDWEHPKDQREGEDFALLLGEISRAFAPAGLQLSSALAPWQDLPAAAYQHLDRIHLMSYDNPGRHSTYEAAVADVQRLLDRGVPAAKIWLGVPFYGRKPEAFDQALTYAQLLAQFNPDPEVDEAGGYYFNGPRTLQRKARFARDGGLGGIMVWELGQDAAGEQSLLRALSQALNSP
ncbi:MAG: glycoside hydrolase family 18 protein [Candidatus Latescibacteria bacterium]|nr:glycoside hydrolase family 18 protein [Candidatus Latescibacterota bacterium]